jgi:hypothetical protein
MKRTSTLLALSVIVCIAAIVGPSGGPEVRAQSCAYCTASADCIANCGSQGLICCAGDTDCNGTCEEFCGSACPAW